MRRCGPHAIERTWPATSPTKAEHAIVVDASGDFLVMLRVLGQSSIDRTNLVNYNA